MTKWYCIIADPNFRVACLGDYEEYDDAKNEAEERFPDGYVSVIDGSDLESLQGSINRELIPVPIKCSVSEHLLERCCVCGDKAHRIYPVCKKHMKEQ